MRAMAKPAWGEGDMKVLKCADVGFQCKGVIRAESVDEVLRQAAAHAKASAPGPRSR
jgi:hypothetical protein